MKLKKPSKKVVLSVLVPVLFIGLVFGGYKGLESINNFFSKNELKFNKIVEVKFNKPIEILTKEEVARRAELEKKANDLIDKAIKIYQDEQLGTYGLPSCECKTETSFNIVKPVQAADNYTFQNHSKKPYYNIVIAGLKSRFTKCQDAAELEALEGGFDPGAINPSSGACGLPQALPCKKMGCSLTDIDCQLNWMKEYVGDRYGTVEKALSFRKTNGWY